MGLRFFRRVHLAPGLTLNLSKGGPSLSAGIRGAHLTVGRAGIRRTVGLPGSGAFYTSQTGWHSGAHTSPHFADATPAPTPRPSGWRLAFHILGQIIEVLGIALLVVLGAILALGGGQAHRRH